MSLMNQSDLIQIKSLGEDIIYSLPIKKSKIVDKEIDWIEESVYDAILSSKNQGITKA